MRYVPPVLLGLALVCFAFAYWGLETPEGRRAYDEMAGIIPFAAGVAALVLVVLAAAIWLWRWFRASRRAERRP